MNGSLVDLNQDTLIYSTLRSQLKAVNSLLFNQFSRFCQNTDQPCPFGPGISSFSYGFNVSKAYQGVPFNVRFVIINAVQENNIVGCIDAQVTPVIASYAYLVVLFIIVGIAVLIAISFLLTASLNPWTGSSNIYSWASVLHRDVNVTRLLTPSLFDFIHYFQFAFFLASLSLDYPSFFQPIVSTVCWVVLMFKSSFVSHSSRKFSDGVYSTSGSFGLQHMSQISQQHSVKDVWASFLVWLLVITAATILIGQLVSLLTWAWRKYHSDNYDLRSKAGSFIFGLVFRIFFNLFALPLLVFSFFQCAVTHINEPVPVYLSIIAAILIALWVIIASSVSYYLWKYAARPTIFDNVSTLLKFGTLYNTYTERAATFFVIDFLATFFRSLSIGAIQSSGLAQITLLAVIELAYLFALIIVRPFDPETSMNLVSAIITCVRFTLVMLTLPFIKSTGVSPEARQWLAYVILIIHALAVLLFFMRAIQVITEVLSRYAGAGADSKRGGAIYNLKQLSRRRYTPGVPDTNTIPNLASNDVFNSSNQTTHSSPSSPCDLEMHQLNTSNTSLNGKTNYSSRKQPISNFSPDAEYTDTPNIDHPDLADDDGLYSATNKQLENLQMLGKNKAGYSMLPRHRNTFAEPFAAQPTNDYNSSTYPKFNTIIPVGTTGVIVDRSNVINSKNATASKNHTNNDYYRKPRRRESSSDWPVNHHVQRPSSESNEYDEHASPTSPTHPYDSQTATNINDIRMGIVSPPPAGVNYAVREADIYYRQRAAHRKQKHKDHTGAGAKKKRKKHKHSKKHPNEEEYYDKTATNTPTLDTLAGPGLLDYNQYQGAAGMIPLLDENSKNKHTPTHSSTNEDGFKFDSTPHPPPAAHSRGNSTDLDTLTTRVGNGSSNVSTPGRLSLVWQGDDSAETTPDGTPRDSATPRASLASESAGILQNRNSGIAGTAHSRRSRNHNSLVGLLEQDEGSGYYRGQDERNGYRGHTFASSDNRDLASTSTIKLAQSTASKTAAVAGWVSRFVKKSVQSVSGKPAKPTEDELLEPRGFEVIRRGPIRPYHESKPSSSSSSEESESSEESSDSDASYSDENDQMSQHMIPPDNESNQLPSMPLLDKGKGKKSLIDNKRSNTYSGDSSSIDNYPTNSSLHLVVVGGPADDDSSALSTRSQISKPTSRSVSGESSIAPRLRKSSSILESVNTAAAQQHYSSSYLLKTKVLTPSVDPSTPSITLQSPPPITDPEVVPPKLSPISPKRPRPMPIPDDNFVSVSPLNFRSSQNRSDTLTQSTLTPTTLTPTKKSAGQHSFGDMLPKLGTLEVPLPMASPSSEMTSTSGTTSDRGGDSTLEYDYDEMNFQQNLQHSMQQSGKRVGVPLPQAVRMSPHVMEISVLPEMETVSSSGAASDVSSTSGAETAGLNAFRISSAAEDGLQNYVPYDGSQNFVTYPVSPSSGSFRNSAAVSRLVAAEDADSRKRDSGYDAENEGDGGRSRRATLVAGPVHGQLGSPMHDSFYRRQPEEEADSPGIGSAITTPNASQMERGCYDTDAGQVERGHYDTKDNQSIRGEEGLSSAAVASRQGNRSKAQRHTRARSSVSSVGSISLQNYAYPSGFGAGSGNNGNNGNNGGLHNQQSQQRGGIRRVVDDDGHEDKKPMLMVNKMSKESFHFQ